MDRHMEPRRNRAHYARLRAPYHRFQKASLSGAQVRSGSNTRPKNSQGRQTSEAPMNHGKCRRFLYRDFWCVVERNHQVPCADAWGIIYTHKDSGKNLRFWANSRRQAFTRLRIFVAEAIDPRLKTVKARLAPSISLSDLAKSFEGIGISSEQAMKAAKHYKSTFPKALRDTIVP